MTARRYTLLTALLLALALAACSGGSQDASETMESAATPAVAPADLVLRGGKVATVGVVLFIFVRNLSDFTGSKLFTG